MCTCAMNCVFQQYAQVKEYTKGTPFEGDNFFLALGTICIMTILVIMKKIYAKKQLQIFLELKREEEEAKRRAEESSDEESDEDNHAKNSLERITEEEYDFQSRVITKQEIRNLVNSDVYKRLAEVKGRDPANWNW